MRLLFSCLLFVFSSCFAWGFDLLYMRLVILVTLLLLGLLFVACCFGLLLTLFWLFGC